MPRYVEDHFIKACRAVGLKVEPRADGLWRIEHVLADLRSDRLQSVRRLGKPEPTYRKITFQKDRLDEDQHIDAVLIGPGHPLYAAVDERLNELLADVAGGVAVFSDPQSEVPYRLHFFEVTIRGQNSKGEPQTLHAEVAAVREELPSPACGRGAGGEGDPARYSTVSADCLLDLPPHPSSPQSLEPFDASAASDYLKSSYQTELRTRCQEERRHFVDVCRDYLGALSMPAFVPPRTASWPSGCAD